MFIFVICDVCCSAMADVQIMLHVFSDSRTLDPQNSGCRAKHLVPGSAGMFASPCLKRVLIVGILNLGLVGQEGARL